MVTPTTTSSYGPRLGDAGAVSPVEAPPKRRRLNFACNYCRSRKSRCDEQKPSCHACKVAGIPCVTVDRRRPGVQITRHEAGATPALHDAAPITPGRRVVADSEEPQNSDPRILPPYHRRSSDAIPLTPRSTLDVQDGGKPQPLPQVSWAQPPRAEDDDPDLAGEMHVETDPVDATTKFSGRLPILRPNRGNCTSELLTDWMDLAFYRLGIKKRLGPLLLVEGSSGMSFRQPELSLNLPPLPEQHVSRELLALYLENVNSVFPLLDARDIDRTLGIALDLSPAQFVHEQGFPQLLIVYLSLSIGALSFEGREWREFSLAVVEFSKSFIGQMIEWNTIQTVQVLFLLSLCLKCHDRIPSSWSVLSACLSMAVSVGLNSPHAAHRREQNVTKSSAEGQRRRTWWSIYCFERLFSFELGRPSFITEEVCCRLTHDNWAFSVDGQTHPQPVFFDIVAGMAELLGEIGSRCIRARNEEDAANSSSIEAAIKEKVKTVGETCLRLLKWADTLPEEYRPRSDCIYDAATFPYASFISFQYNNVLLNLTQNSLLVSSKAIQIAVDTIAKGAPWEHVIRNGPSIAANTARRTIQLLMEGADLNVKTLLPSVFSPLHALYVLSINIIRHPKSRLARSDLNLIHDAADFATRQYGLMNTDHRLHIVLSKVDKIVTRVMQLTASTPVPRAAASPRNSFTLSAAGEVDEVKLGRTLLPSESQGLYGGLGVGEIDLSAAFRESPAMSLDVSLSSPEHMHDIGWDWVDFTQMFSGNLGTT
ncbi:fungal-specific transcription factor domain-containing protein [Xylariales sp. PMI_506]|nr:fungal-specific transcription factor domain-containing protein [Xylariales sp. PMI_506]